MPTVRSKCPQSFIDKETRSAKLPYSALDRRRYSQLSDPFYYFFTTDLAVVERSGKGQLKATSRLGCLTPLSPGTLQNTTSHGAHQLLTAKGLLFAPYGHAAMQLCATSRRGCGRVAQ
jgi:hypothetical protein